MARTLLTLLFALCLMPILGTPVEAQGSDGTQVRVAGMPAPMVRTRADRRASAQTEVQRAPEIKPFRPTMDPAAYLAIKAAAGAERRAGATPSNVPLDISPRDVPAVEDTNCNGIAQGAPLAGSGFPPDTHGAVGTTQYVHIVNSAIRVHSKVPTPAGDCPTLETNSLAVFFLYFE